jgi:hypothetical protein
MLLPGISKDSFPYSLPPSSLPFSFPSKASSMKRFLLLFLILAGFGVRAQTDAPPVTAAVQTLPPFTPNLSDWSDPLNNKIGITLLLNDRAQPGYQVQLRLTIEGQGVRLTTSPDWAPTPISLSYGIPTQLTGIDLLAYFDLDHLNFSGISRQQYLAQGGLPEGTYSICVEALDIIRTDEGSASLSSCSFVQARLLDPPVILSPIGLQTPISPQLLLVQWQARHTASFMTDYTLEIYQEDPGMTPEQVFALQQPYVETQLSGMTSTIIDAAFPILQQGVRYFARVRAEDPMGASVFKNGGYSELAFFTYGSNCPPPQGLTVDVQSHDRARVNWNFRPGSASYIVRYREQNEEASWYEDGALLNYLQLEDLQDSITYEVQIQSVCGNTPGEFGAVFEFTTPIIPFDLENLDCGDDIEDIAPPTNNEPIETLSYASKVQVGQFEMKVTIANANDDGSWSGAGQIYVPWIGQRLNCTFDSLGINDEGIVFDGEVVAIDDGLESVDGFLTEDDIAEMMDTATINFCGEQIAIGSDEEEGEEDAEEDEDEETAPTFEELRAGAGGTNLPFVQGQGTERMALYNMVFTATAATVDAYSSARIPMGDRFVAFGAEGVGFQLGGLQGESQMELLTDIVFDWNGKMRFSIVGQGDSYIAFDCGGITEIGLQANIDFCRELMIPVDPNTKAPIDTGYASATFTGVATSWSQFTGEVDIAPFESPKLPDWTFLIEDAVLDFSDDSTPESVTFPEDYAHPDVDAAGEDGSASPAWTGFYLGRARVSIPERFVGGADRDSTQAPAIGVSGLLIDGTGFSGSIFGENILTLENGRAGSWAMSLDSIAITFMHDQFESTNLSGELEVPSFDEPLLYNCHIQPGGLYAFSIALQDTVTMSAMVADFSLYENTRIGIEYDEEEEAFNAYAVLYGHASFSPIIGGGSSSSGRSSGGGSGGSSGGGSAQNNNNSGGGGQRLTLAEIDFEDFHISSQAPYIINIGSWSLSANTNEGQPVLAGFPLQLNEVSMVHDTAEQQVAFGLAMTLNLVAESDQGFGAYGRAFIICDVTVDTVTMTQNWEFNRVRVDKLALDYVGAGFKFNGYIELFEEDETYGSGYSGGIQAGFTPGISVGAAVLFGKVDGYRYFFADALLAIDPGVTIGTTGMAIYGFGGGVSYHMAREGFANLVLPPSAATEAAEEKEGADAGAENAGGAGQDTSLEEALTTGDPAANFPPAVPLPGELGVSLSGVSYVPDDEVNIGIKAMIAFGSINREVFNGDVTLEVIFNTDGGMNYIGLMGNANFVTPPPTIADLDPEASFSAYVDMGYDFENESFSAYLRAKAYLAEGLITGAYADYVAGDGAIYADADDWYIYIGTPDVPIKMSYDLSALANIGGDDASASPPPASGNPHDGNDSDDLSNPLGEIGAVGLLLHGYLDAGTILPPFPDPPQVVMNMISAPASGFDQTSRDDPSLASAKNLLFGAGFDVTMPELRFMSFYAYINAGLAFDMLLRNYGTDAVCTNLAPSSSPIGMNGWYATGQFYGYLEAGVGIKVDIFGFGGSYPIFDVGVAALLQARMPNPMWMKGQLGGQYSILGGMVRGNCEFEFEAGTACDIGVSGRLAEIAVIESITPSDQATDVNVFAKPQALFNFAIDQVLVLQDDDENFVNLKPTLREFTVTDVTTSTTVPGELQWNQAMNVAAFRPDDILGGNRDVSVTVTIDVLKRVNGNWIPLVIDGETIINTETVTFTTGPAPDHIVEENVRYAYPINRQLNFHRNEAGAGFIKLNQGQDYLFLGQSNCTLDTASWTQRIRFQQGDNAVSTTPFSYNGNDNQLNFAIPSGQMQDGKVSYFDILNVPVGQDFAVDANLTAVERDLADNLPDGASADNATTVLLSTREAASTLNGLKEKSLYRLDFRTSDYVTFSAKVATMASQYNFLSPQALTIPTDTIINDDGSIFTGPYLSIDDFGKVVLPAERMDVFDLEGEQLGAKNIGPLVRGEANLGVTANNWYNTHPKPNMYDRFPHPATGIDLLWREKESLGHPPTRAIDVRQQSGLPLTRLTDFSVSSGIVGGSPEDIQLNYHAPYVMYKDFIDYWNLVGNYATNNPLPPDLQSFYNWNFIYPGYGNYEVRLQYFLPGQTTPNSSFTIQLPYDVLQLKK